MPAFQNSGGGCRLVLERSKSDNHHLHDDVPGRCAWVCRPAPSRLPTILGNTVGSFYSQTTAQSHRHWSRSIPIWARTVSPGSEGNTAVTFRLTSPPAWVSINFELVSSGFHHTFPRVKRLAISFHSASGTITILPR